MRCKCLETSGVADPFRRCSIDAKWFAGMMSRAGSLSVVQYDAEQRLIYLEPAVVLNESQFLEFVHEEIDARARGANHFGQGLLRYFGNDPLRLFLFAVAGKQ